MRGREGQPTQEANARIQTEAPGQGSECCQTLLFFFSKRFWGESLGGPAACIIFTRPSGREQALALRSLLWLQRAATADERITGVCEFEELGRRLGQESQGGHAQRCSHCLSG